MKKILILGSTGMLGHQVYYTLTESNKFIVSDLSFRNKLNEDTIIADVTNFNSLNAVIQNVKPDVIVNCIGVLIKGSQDNPKNAILINSYLPHWLVSVADDINAKVIHISTDCVFSGKAGGYVESSFRDADDVYGRSKSLGEIQSEKHLTLRTSIIGPELKSNGEGLFHWFMNQSVQVNGYTNAYWGGVTTHELSKVILSAIEMDTYGVVNITNGERISKFDLLSLINSTYDKGLLVKPYEGKSVDKSLKSERSDWLYKVPSYSVMIREMKEQMQVKASLYTSIYGGKE